MSKIKSDIKFSSEEIYTQVDKICQSGELDSKKLLCRLFKYLIDETIAGREDRLKGYTIGVDVFNKNEDFDPEQDPLVRIHAGRLRRALKLYYLEDGKLDPIRIEIPKGKYIPYFYANTYNQDDEIQIKQPKNWSTKPTIAILPFKNLSGNPAKDYFALGFSEELSVDLTKFDDLLVFESVPFSSNSVSDSERYNYLHDKRIRFVIEGGVLLTDTQIKVLVRLTDKTTGEQIWAERYLRDLTASNLIEIQENIITEISSILGSEYGIILQKVSYDIKYNKPKQLDTFSAISKFYFYIAHHTIEAAMDAFEALEGALKNDPNSGIAHAMLAFLYGNRYTLDYPGAEEAYYKTKEHAARAMELDPQFVIVRIVNAYNYFVYDNKNDFIREAEKCLSRTMSPSLRLGTLGFYFSLFGEWERGKAILDNVINTKITYPLYYHGATMLYYFRKKDYAKALTEAMKYDIPALFWGPMLRAAVLGQLNKSSEAKAHIDHLKQLKPEFEIKARYLISRFVKEDELVEHVMEGLRKAGMKV